MPGLLWGDRLEVAEVAGNRGRQIVDHGDRHRAGEDARKDTMEEVRRVVLDLKRAIYVRACIYVRRCICKHAGMYT
jgi:hypothetical protein